MNPAQSDAAVVLDREIQAMEAVLGAIEAEYAALKARDAEALNEATRLKQTRLEDAQRVGAERAAALPDGPGAGPRDLEPRWQQLVELAKACSDKNEINGLLINQQRRYVEQTIAMLRNDPQDSKVYGPDGARDTGLHRRGDLGSA